MSIKERRNINTYLTKDMYMKNQLKAFGKTVTNKIFIKIILNELLWSY